MTHTKTIITRANKKPWLTGAVHRLLRVRDKAFRAGDRIGLRTARASLSRGIRKAKQDYTKKITSHFKDSRDTRSLWQGIQSITDCKPASQTCDDNISLLNDLNSFFARFEATNNTSPQKTGYLHEYLQHFSESSCCSITFQDLHHHTCAKEAGSILLQ